MAKKRKSANKLLNVELHRLAHYAFFAGILIAIIAGIFRNYFTTSSLISTLLILGFLVGLFNLTVKEENPFLIAAIALMLAGIVNIELFDVFGFWPKLGPALRYMLNNIVVFVAPAAIIVGMKKIWRMASN